MLQYAPARTWNILNYQQKWSYVTDCANVFLTKLVSSFEIQIVSININYVQASFFLVLVVSKWLARFSTICMRDGFVSFIVNNMFKSASCCRWVIKCFTQCMVLYCILCSKINLKYFFYEVIKSKAWIYSYCVCCSSLFVALFFFTMGVSSKLGHSHASGGFSRVCRVSLVCLTIEDCIYRAPGSCSVKIACVWKCTKNGLKSPLVAPGGLRCSWRSSWLTRCEFTQ